MILLTLTPIVALGLKLQFMTNKVGRIITLEYQVNEEAREMYRAMLTTARQNQVSVPMLESLNVQDELDS